MQRSSYRKRGLSVIIPAAGIGSRMKYYSPKPLIELRRQQTVLGRQVSLVKEEYPDAEVIAVLGFEAEKIIKQLPNDVKIVENERYHETNVVRSIGLALRIVPPDNDVLIVYGDLVFNATTIHNLTSNGSVAVVDKRKQLDCDEVGVTVVDGRATQFNYGLPDKWAQILFLADKELELFKQVAWDAARKRWYGFEAMNEVIERGGIIKVSAPRRMKIVELDTPHHVEAARKIK